MKKLLPILILIGSIFLNACMNNAQNRQNAAITKKQRILITKNQRLLQILEGEQIVKEYKIALGFAPDGDKSNEGDGKTPEGKFYVFTKNHESKFHLSLGLSYPNVEAAKRGLKSQIISKEEFTAIEQAISEKRMPPQKTALGGEIYIHGGGDGTDWTQGCIALKNEEIKEIFDVISVGAEVEIRE